MLDIFGANIFDVGRGTSTKSLNVRDYMKAFGYNEFDDSDNPVTFTPIKQKTEGLDLVQTASNSYSNSIARLNAFGVNMAAKGINVFSPDPNNKAAIRASGHFQKMGASVNNELAALLASAELRKQQNDLLSKENTVGSRPGPELVSPQDVGVTNIQTYRNPLEAEAKAINDVLAGEYDTFAQVDKANAEIDTRKKKLWDHVDVMTEAGIPLDQARAEVQSIVDSIGIASHNPLNERRTSAEAALKAERARTERTKQAKNSGADKEERITKRAELIAAIQSGNGLDAFIGKNNVKAELVPVGRLIEEAEEARKSGEVVEAIKIPKRGQIVITKKDGDEIRVDLDDRFAINNLLDELVPAKFKVGFDELINVPEITNEDPNPLLNKVLDKSGFPGPFKPEEEKEEIDFSQFKRK